MLQRLKNVILSLKTYRDLSPDGRVRQQVKRALRHRPAYSQAKWYQTYCLPFGISEPIAQFAYTHLSQYSQLDFARVTPSDRLNEDLHWIEVCWFDWEMNLCEDFYQKFGIDLTDYLEELDCLTVADLLRFLEKIYHTQRANR